MEEDKATLEAGVDMMLRIAVKLLNKKARENTILLVKGDPDASQRD